MNDQLITLALLLSLASLCAGAAEVEPLPAIRAQLGQAHMATEGRQLFVSTGVVERQWIWNGTGLATTSLRHVESGREWAVAAPSHSCDWNLPGLVEAGAKPVLVSLTARESDDEGFTSPHIEVCAELEYPGACLALQYVIWVYPDAPGVRTQLRLKALPGYAPPDRKGAARTEFVPVALEGITRRAAGYFNDTQHRNRPETEILREECVTEPFDNREVYDWASLLVVEDAFGGLALVKESHKCANQKGVDTGVFECTQDGLAATGLGPGPKDIQLERWANAWANWSILYVGGDNERELAVKVFDRFRYPVDPARDLFIMANTWGSSENKDQAQSRASQENVLREIASQADLGIDVQQIDDGWQGGDYDSWRPVEERYPDGWGPVKEAAAEADVTLGLWAAVRIGTEDLIWNYDQGGFRYFKLDFANLNSYEKLTGLMDKVRSLVLHSGHRVRVNWDVTENPPRVGYFFAREYGNIYLENRKPRKPDHVVYIPHLVLRDAWQVSKYCNLNKFQVTVENIDRVNPDISDAPRHNHPYCVAISLMGSPIFFQETQFYSEEARAGIRPLLAAYKRHRAEMFSGYVFPIGEKPDNAGWPGFQCHIASEKAGYLLIFREIGSTEQERGLRLRFVEGRPLRLTNLLSGEQTTCHIGSDGEARFVIEEPAGFRFYRYEAGEHAAEDGAS